MSKKISLYDFTEFDSKLRDTMREVLTYSKLLDETFDEYYKRFGIDLRRKY